MSYNATMRVWRGDEAGGALQDFTVEVNEGEVVLDIIHRLQQTQTPDLAVRWNCKAGKCGSCSAEINGRPGLLCMTRMSTFTGRSSGIELSRVMHINLGMPLISAEHDPHLPALQFQRTARSLACSA